MGKNKGFTFIETLIVITIIGLLTGFGTITYTQQSKSARDATRKNNLEEIAQALEQYRSNHTYGSYPTVLSTLAPSYIKTLPQDPKTKTDYSYTAYPQEPACSDAVPQTNPNPCTSYILGTILETDSQAYYFGPYGSTTIQPTSAPTTPPISTPILIPTSTPIPTPIPPTPTPVSCNQACTQKGYTKGSCDPSCEKNKETKIDYVCSNPSEVCCCK